MIDFNGSKRWSGYDRYVIRRSLYSCDSDIASSPSTDSSLNGCTIHPIPSRFHFPPLVGRDAPRKKLFNWPKLKLGRKPTETPFRILSEVATTKLTRQYDLTATELGRGVSGTVFMVHRRNDNGVYAAKAYVKRPVDGKYSRKKFLARISGEVVMLAQLHHENVIRTFDIAALGDQLVTVMEFCHTTLFRLVKGKSLSPSDTAELFSQLGAGVAYLHNECGIAHRDLKLENLGIGQDGQLKILDFGSAIRLPLHPPLPCSVCLNQDHFPTINFPEFKLTSRAKVRGLCGSDPYMAPEIWESSTKGMGSGLGCRCCGACGYDPFKADIWSMGIIYIAMHSAKFPWAVAKSSDPDFTLFRAHTRHRLSKFKLAPANINLALGMLTLCPIDRLDIDRVMTYPSS
ncbi:hypothetical protein L0F63_003003 [Massospora cicadina]|nr:hypothetical protein L0F63_003003 [Massospora cicadina]